MARGEGEGAGAPEVRRRILVQFNLRPPMKTTLKSTLERAINKWAEKACESEDRPDGFWNPNLVDHMVHAAEVVFDSSFESAEYAESESSTP